MTENKKNQEFKIRKIRRNIEYSFRGSDRYFDLFIVFLVAGIVLWAVSHSVYVMGAGSRVSCYIFSVPNVRINIRKYHDIPAETPYAPGEQCKGGQ